MDPGARCLFDSVLGLGRLPLAADAPGFGEVNLSTGYHARPYCSFDDGSGMAIYGNHFNFASRWNGAGWIRLGLLEGFNSGLHMAGLDLGDGPALYVAGDFTRVAATPGTRGVARYKNGQWQSLGGGLVSGQINDMIVFDDGRGRALYVSGVIESAGGVPIQYGIARWDGQGWSSLPSGPDGWVRNLMGFDDGSGPALYVTGAFASAGGVPARNIAKFDGTRWWPLGAGTPSTTERMIVFDDGRGPSLFVTAGGGEAGGGYSSPGLIQWVGCPNCQADCDNNHRLDINDFVCFMRRYAVRDPYTNCNVDATINVADFLCYQQKFAQGCP